MEILPSRHLILLLLVLFTAGVVRFTYVIFLPGQGRDLLHSDMEMYDEAGWRMSQGQPVTGKLGFNGYHPLSASTFYYPGYTYFLAAVYYLFGHSILAVRIIQAGLSMASVGLLYVIGVLIFGRRVALVAAALSAVYLPLAYYAGLVLTETVFLILQLLVLLTWLLACGVRWPGSTATQADGVTPISCFSLLLAAIAGMFAGMAAMTRPAFLPGIGSLALVGIFVQRNGRRWLGRLGLSLLFCLGAATAIAPVTIRNFQIHRRFILLSTNGPSAFYTAHITKIAFLDYPTVKPMTDAEMAEEIRKVCFDYLRQHWLDYLAEIPEFFHSIFVSGEFWPNTMTAWRYSDSPDPKKGFRIRMLIDEPGGPRFGTVLHFPDLMRYVDQLLWILIGLPMGITAWMFLPRANRKWLILYASLFPYLVVPFVASPFARYRVPAVPLMFLLAALSVCSLMDLRRKAIELRT